MCIRDMYSTIHRFFYQRSSERAGLKRYSTQLSHFRLGYNKPEA